MTINTKSIFNVPKITSFVLAVPFALIQSVAALADESWPFATLPESFVGMTNGALQPEDTFRAYIGSAQPSRASAGGQTGRQVYFGGFTYRFDSPLQFGAGVAIFDDAPAAAINGSFDTATYVGWGLDLKYRLYEGDRLSAALQGGIEAAYFSRGAGLTDQSTVAPGDKGWFLASTLSLPITYQLTNRIWVTGEVGYTNAAPSLIGERGFGGRVFAAAGMAYQLSDRFFTYGAFKALARQLDNGIDAQDQGGLHHIYTVGGQFALTPQSIINVYVTNAFSPSSFGDDILFFPQKTEPVFGVMLSYIPSGRGVGDAALTFRPADRPQGEGSRYSDGFTIRTPHTLASDRVHARLAYGAAGQSMLSLLYTPDPNFQIEFAVEDYALTAGSDFRPDSDEGLRFMIGGRWQAMDQAYGDPFNLGFGISAGRNFGETSLGALFFEANASRGYDWGEATVNARSAIYAAETLVGLGAAISYDLSETVSAIGEFTAVLDDDPVWALGLRYSPLKLPLSIDLYYTNAAGLNGLGTLLSNDNPQLGLSIHWEGGLDLL